MAAKRTADLIPLCHPLPLSHVEVSLSVGDAFVEITASVETTAQTGVEMEALTAASVAALTVYDMAKAIDKEMVIDGVRLLEKTKETGREGRRADVSPTGSRRGRARTGAATCSRSCSREGFEVIRRVVPDEREAIADAILELAGEAELVLTTGGTGLGPRDVTPEATMQVLDRAAPGIAEAIRADSIAKTPHALLSRGTAGVCGTTLVVNLPGSPGGCRDGFAVLRAGARARARSCSPARRSRATGRRES